MSHILDGKKLSEKIAKQLKKEFGVFAVPPTLAIIQIGEKAESSAYIARKKDFGNDVGVKVHHILLPEKISTEKVIEAVEELNKRKDVQGIIVQLPIPKHIDKFQVIEAIDPSKDVDGLTVKNAGLLYASAFGGNDPRQVPKGLVPATAKGVISLLKENKISLVGKKVLVIGRSMLVGKPVAMLLLKENATVTVAHSKTKQIDSLSRENDIVVVAVGKAKFFNKKFARKGQVVIDVGTNAVVGSKVFEEGVKRKIVGDVDFAQVSKIVSYISPVPGGVGPMTVASLFQNLLSASKK